MRLCSAPADCRRALYPEATEIMPQVELRYISTLYAGRADGAD